MELIIENFHNESGVSKLKIRSLIIEISSSLCEEGCSKSDPRFNRYLLRRLRKRLNIIESKTYQSFKQFFQK